MSRIAKKPITIPSGVDIGVDGSHIKIKGSKAAVEYTLHSYVAVEKQASELIVKAGSDAPGAWMQAGTARALLQNIITGVTHGFERKLNLVGVGYRAQIQGKVLNLSLGYSHPIKFDVPAGVTIETPSNTEILIKGSDKQLVGQVAANIRGFRPPEPYKGKGVCYAGEKIRRKEAKKK